MQSLVAERTQQVAALCRRFQVRRLDLFGSAATESFDPRSSDLDFLVEFNELEPGQYADAYFGLLAGLEELFGRRIDLVTSSAVRNPYLLRSITASKTALYAA
jgi:predicted nucleotidyltransferase